MKTEKKNFIIHPIPVLSDNIIWIWVKGNQAVVVDPALAQPVISWIKAKKLTLTSILQTHHHEDHIGGTKGLLNIWPSTAVIASKNDLDRIPFQTQSVSDGQNLNLLGEKVKVLELPGHTKNHISFYICPQSQSNEDPVLFPGDTLFGGGCGRLFEGTPTEMFTSLNRLNKLPGNTKIYCAHEYTEANLRWATSIAPRDVSIKDRYQKVMNKRTKGLLSLPSSLSEERKTNLFIRAKNLTEFAELRLHKDNWKG